MRAFVPTMRHAMIASMLLRGKPVRQIAREMNQNPGTFSRTVKRMERNGYIMKQFRSHHTQYSLTLLGYSLLDMIRTKDQKGNTTGNGLTGSVIRATPTEKPAQFWRLHALQFKIPFVEAFRPDSIHLIQLKDHPTRLRQLNNHSDLLVEFQDFTCTITTRALKITGIQVRLPYEDVEDPEVLLEKARDMFMPEIENLEMIFRKHFPRLKLRRLANNVLDVQVVKGELALEQDTLAIDVAEVQEKTGEKLRIYDPEDGKLSFIVDMSKGPEAEGVHPKKFIYYMQVYKSFLDDLFTGKFYERFEAIQKVEQDQQQILKKTQELALQHTQRTDESISQVIDLVQKVSLQFYSSLNELKTYQSLIE